MGFDIDTMLADTEENRRLREEVNNADWAQYGKTIAARMMDDQAFTMCLNRASMKAKTTIEMVRMIRIYLVSGAMP